jgi:hypothetical protein
LLTLLAKSLVDSRGCGEGAWRGRRLDCPRGRGAKIVLRSKTPDLVRQEFHGLMMTHFAIRGLMHEAALKADVDPDRLSFIRAVRVIKRKLPSFLAIPPLGAEPRRMRPLSTRFSRNAFPLVGVAATSAASSER